MRYDVRMAEERDLRPLQDRLTGDDLVILRHRLMNDDRGRLLRAVRGLDTVGSVIVSWAPADEREVRAALPGVPLMYLLRVDQPYRCQGIGTGLIRRGEAYLRGRGHDRVLIGVDQANTRAGRLYRALGYRNMLVGLAGSDGPYDILVRELGPY
ncbi:GNAT family N-acetyltransferase [Actinoplanes sp. NPDC051470]|uniref:GNAT family N-acetyltransferase n=1 Tax=unclassified Actinoplanes TaxID=2626549 RepID=UPI00344349AB